MNLQLDNKVAILTAATDGLGFATAKQLLAEGARVAICGRDQARNQAALQALIALSSEDDVLVQQCDITDRNQIENFVLATVKKFGKIDIAITNAGGPPTGTFESLDVDAYEAGFKLTLMSAVHLIKAVLPYLKQSDAASILTMTSVSAKQPIPNLYISNVLRPAVIGFTKALSQEHGKDNIRVNSILPGWTATEHTLNLVKKRAEMNHKSFAETENAITSSIPLGRMGTPEEFANVATFLVSPAAGNVNGVMMQVDGGSYQGLL